jgi:hypothetical protein
VQVHQLVVQVKESDFRDYGDVEIDYFIQGVRVGYEDHIAIQDIEPTASYLQSSTKEQSFVLQVRISRFIKDEFTVFLMRRVLNLQHIRF